MDLEETIKKYNAELQDDLMLDDFVLHDKQMRMPGIKHKWVARLIHHKTSLHKLKEGKESAIEEIQEQIRAQALTVMSSTALKAATDKHELVKKFNNRIKQEELVIDYLERVEKICAQTSFDIKNIVELKKLEVM